MSLKEKVRFRPRTWADVHERTRVADDAGGFTPQWSTKPVRRVCFDVKWNRGIEDIHAQQIVGLGSGTFTTRWSRGFTFSRVDHRLQMDDGRILDIVHVENIEEQNRLVRLYVETIDVD